MATQPTNLPVPSESPRDLKFNAGKIDEFVTSPNHTYTDRFGSSHWTIAGINYSATQAISNFGYITLDSFEEGNNLTLPNQVLRYEATGEYYRWDGELPKTVPAGSTPQNSGGIGKGSWISVGDASLRSDLAKPNGAEQVFYGQISVKEALDLITVRSDQFPTLKEWAEFDAPVKVFVAGDYTLDETLNIKCDELMTTGRVNVTMTQPTPFIILGSADQEEIVSSATAVIQRGANNLTVPAGSNVNIGDVLFIWNPVDYSFSPWRSYLRQGEAVTVADVGTTNVVLTGKVFDQYPVGTKVIKPKMSKKRISGDFFVTFPQLTGTHTYSPNSVGMLAIQLLDSDFTGFSMKTKQASQAFILRRSVNCHGTGMNNSQAIFGDATLGLDSGLGLANSQGCRFEGRFSGERHGVSVSGNSEPGSIPCRFNVIGGEILSTSKDSKTAGDWHGGCEYNYYYGRIMGITAGGNHNGVLPGSVVESLGYPTSTNATEPTIGFREMDGCDFMFSGITVRAQGKPSTAFKGVVDCGSISSILNSQVKAGGTIDFSGTSFECEDTEYVFKIRSTDFNLKWGLNLSDVVIKSGGIRPIWIAANSGKEADWVNMNGLQFNSNCTDPIINTVSPSMNYTRSGRVSATIPAGSSSVQIVVNLDTALPAKYFVNAIALGNYAKGIVISNDQRQASQFRLTIKTSDGTNAAAAIAVDIGYTVIL